MHSGLAFCPERVSHEEETEFISDADNKTLTRVSFTTHKQTTSSL